MTKEEKIDALRSTLNSAGWTQIIKPTLETAIKTATMALVTGRRNETEKSLTDDNLKGRLTSFMWIQEWEKNLEGLVAQLAQLEEMAERTEHLENESGPF